MCVHMCNMEARSRHWLSASLCLHLISGDSLPLNLELGRLANEPQGSPPTTSSTMSVISTCHCTRFYVGVRNSNLVPHACAAGTLPTEPSPDPSSISISP